MNFQEIIAGYEKRAAKVGKPMYLVCTDAGIAPSTFYRWLNDGDAKISNLSKIEKALTKLEKKPT